MTPTIVGLVIAGIVVLVLASIALSLRAPEEFGPNEYLRDPADPAVTTISRLGVMTTRFTESGKPVARAETFGQGDRGVVLRLAGDAREILFTAVGDWFEVTRFGLRDGAQLLLVVDGETVARAHRALDSKRTGNGSRVFEIETAGRRFEFVQRALGKYALAENGRAIGIATWPALHGLADRIYGRIELPRSLPLETRLFLALLVEAEDRDWS